MRTAAAVNPKNRVVCPGCTGDGCELCNRTGRVLIGNFEHVRYRADVRRWEAMKTAFVDDTHLAMMRDQSFAPMYAYIKPAGPGTWAEIRAVSEYAETPAGFELVTAERIPPGTKEQIRQWFARYADRLSVFPY